MKSGVSKIRLRYVRAILYAVGTMLGGLLGFAKWHSQQEVYPLRLTDERFVQAIQFGETRQLELMLKAGFKPATPQADGVVLLTKAVMSMHAQAIPLLAEGRLNERDAEGSTALHSAASVGFKEGVVELLKAGADRSLKDNYGRNALHCAAQGGHFKTVEVLLEAGISADDTTAMGLRAADLARLGGFCDLERLLIDHETQPPPSPRNEPCKPSLAEIRPSICTGADPHTRVSAGHDRGVNYVNVCRGTAGIYAIDDPPAGHPLFSLGASCCALPATDITRPYVKAVRYVECPENTIIIGAKRRPDLPLSRTTVFCAPINDHRYILGPPTPGVGWGMGSDWRTAKYRRDEIPSAIRSSVGRFSSTTWDCDGCIGDPIGSLLVRVATGPCSSSIFRQLQYAGLPGDPPKGTPVQMFPDCDTAPDVWSTDTTCDGPDRYTEAAVEME